MRMFDSYKVSYSTHGIARYMASHLPDGNPPTENTLTINITHEILSIVHRIFPKAVAVSPTRQDESKYGYDVAADWKFAKSLAFQYKRPQAETGSIQGLNLHDHYVKFPANSDQWETLKDNFEPGEAFLALPNVRDRADMPGNLHRDTIFIDVHALNVSNPTLLYASDWNHLIPGTDIYVRGDSGPRQIDPKWVFNWDSLWSNILSCDAGRLLRVNGDIYFRDEQSRDGVISRTTRIVVVGGNELPNQADWNP